MASRRSSRLQGRQATDPANPVLAPELTVKPAKRKPSASKAGVLFRPITKQAKRSKARAARKPRNTKKSAVQPVLPALPQEVFDMILDRITDPPTIGKMARTCKKYHSIMIPRLHQRVAVTALLHAHIPKLIQSIEPYLSTFQKKALKKLGRYEGQQETYSSHLAEHEVPECASFVQQMIVGLCDPGVKHEHIVHAYLGEAFKNMKNLRIVETRVMTESIAQSLASMEHLQALSISLIKFNSDARPFLSKLKNLKHFSVINPSYSPASGQAMVPQIIVNSRATLRSLVIICPNKGGVPPPKAPEKGREFPNLASLTLERPKFDPDFFEWLQRSVDFMGLRELYLQPMGEDKASFFDRLATQAASRASSEVALRTLYVDLANGFSGRPESNQLDLDAKIRFLSSFDTLKSLELRDYNQHNVDLPNPGIPDSLLSAILKHKGLKTLKISYLGFISDYKVPFVPAETLAIILDGLPLLEEIQFAPELDKLDEIASVLPRGANLKSIICCPDKKPGLRRAESWAETILERILEGFLAHNPDGNTTKKFVWEDHTKLQKVSAVSRMWQIRSNFTGKAPKGALKPEMATGEEFDDRGVMYRDVTSTVPSGFNRGFDPTHPWVEKVAKDMN